jgi:predicted small lipoprotein YifL
MSVMAKRAFPILAVALLLAGCGVRGSLQNPKAEGGGPAQPQPAATADSGQNKPENAAPKPHSGFILDGLLR